MKRALILAGNDASWTLLRAILNGLDLRCHRVTGTSDALAIASAHRFTLTLLDTTTGIDCLALLTALRRFGLNATLPAILLADHQPPALPPNVVVLGTTFDLSAVTEAARDAIEHEVVR